MRGMIVAAGLGTRLIPLTHLRPKPALPVRGLPLIAYQLRLQKRDNATRKLILQGMLDLISPVTTFTLGRCVASTR